MEMVSPNEVYADPLLIVGSVSALAENTLIDSSANEDEFVVFRLMAKMYDDFVAKFRKAAEGYRNDDKYIFCQGKDGVITRIVIIRDDFLSACE